MIKITLKRGIVTFKASGRSGLHMLNNIWMFPLNIYAKLRPDKSHKVLQTHTFQQKLHILTSNCVLSLIYVLLLMPRITNMVVLRTKIRVFAQT